jgi:hypothetical protein
VTKRLTLGGVVILIVAIAAVILTQRSAHGPTVPSEAQARAALDTKFRVAQSGDARAFCGDTDIVDMCESQWERLGGKQAVPRTAPRIASVREQDGYRVLRVCGNDGLGQRYRSDFVVGIKNRRIAYVLPVFWNGATFSGVHGDEAQPTVDGSVADSGAVCS